MVTKTARSRKNERDLIWVSSEIALVTDVRQTVTLEIRVCQTARQFPAYPSLPADHQPYPEAEQNAYFNLHLQSSSKNGPREDAKTRRFQRYALTLRVFACGTALETSLISLERQLLAPFSDPSLPPRPCPCSEAVKKSNFSDVAHNPSPLPLPLPLPAGEGDRAA